MIDVHLIDNTPELSINTTLNDYTSQQAEYTVENFGNFSEGSSLYLKMIAFEGYGTFSVAYC